MHSYIYIFTYIHAPGSHQITNTRKASANTTNGCQHHKAPYHRSRQISHEHILRGVRRVWGKGVRKGGKGVRKMCEESVLLHGMIVSIFSHPTQGGVCNDTHMCNGPAGLFFFFGFTHTTLCNTLQSTASNCIRLLYTATHCNSHAFANHVLFSTLQHIAAHCNTL